MTRQQESQFNMFQGVDGYLTPNSELTKDLPEYPVNFAAFRNNITEIHRISELQNFDKTGFAREKKQLRQVLQLLAWDNSQKLSAYARLTNNEVLLREVRFTRSDLKEANETLLKDYAKMVYDRAQSNLGSLGGYGITEETQTVLINSINSFNASVIKPRLGLIEKSDATRQLAALFKETGIVLEKIDSVINILMLKQPDFYNRYKDIRKVVVTGAGSVALKAKAVQLPGGTPLKGVKFTFKPDNSMMAGNGELSKKTADKGIFYLKSIPEGTYKVKITKTGFKEKEVTVSVVPGEMAQVYVEMEKA